MKTLGISIESLPSEILLEIINYVSDLPHKKENISNLSLISRRFYDIACPILFSRVCLGGFTSSHRHKKSQLKELSKGGTKASASAKHLSIDYSSSFPKDPARVFSPLEKVMLKHLKSAVRSFRGITTMSWNIGQYDPLWVMDSIIYELATIPTLRDINLNYLQYSSQIGNLDAFSNLRKIRVQVASFGLGKAILELGKLLAQCPGLTDLDISIWSPDNMSQLFQFLDQSGKPLSLRHLRINGMFPDCLKLAIENFRSLQSLHIYRFSSNSMGHIIWDTLRNERIYIENLSTDAADDSLLHYLSSFHGMRKFSIIKKSYLSLHRDPITILQIMIPHHAESLTELSMLAGSESQISDLILSENLINLLSSVKNLQYFGLQLHSTPCIESIIQTCTKIFPKLQQLVLQTSWMALYPESAISTTTIVHDAITQYQPDDLPIASFEIGCEGRVYFPGQEGTFSLVT